MVSAPTGDIVATDLQSALVELDNEKLALTGGSMTGNLSTTGTIYTSGDITTTSDVTATEFSGELNGTINATTTGITQPIATMDNSIATTLFVKNAVLKSPTVQQLASTASFIINTDLQTDGVLTAIAITTIIGAPIGNPVQGQKLTFRFKDNGVSQTLTWNGIFREIGVTLPTSTNPGKLIYVDCKYNSDDTSWDVLSIQQEL